MIKRMTQDSLLLYLDDVTGLSHINGDYWFDIGTGCPFEPKGMLSSSMVDGYKVYKNGGSSELHIYDGSYEDQIDSIICFLRKK